MNKKQFKQRLTDLYTGAYGAPPEADGQLIHGGNAQQLEAFLRAINSTWHFRLDDAQQPCWLRVWHIDKLDSIATLADHLWDELVTEVPNA